VEWLAFLSHSRFVTVSVSSGTEDLSLLVECSVTYLGWSLIISDTVFSASVAYLFVDIVKCLCNVFFVAASL